MWYQRIPPASPKLPRFSWDAVEGWHCYNVPQWFGFEGKSGDGNRFETRSLSASFLLKKLQTITRYHILELFFVLVHCYKVVGSRIRHGRRIYGQKDIEKENGWQSRGNSSNLGTRWTPQKKGSKNWYYRCTINGKVIDLSTGADDIDDAEKIATAKFLPMTQATQEDVLAGYVTAARKLQLQSEKLYLDNAWDVYSTHPERAKPATISEQEAYR